ncbi:hypothetical protein Gogos_015363, partial [Gossypium gossypioides]|nr:hypothetical protein [Gossypium gossypioides]
MIFQSCNGLHLCISWKRFFIYNPTTKKFKWFFVPSPECKDRRLLAISLAFDPLKSTHHKLVLRGIGILGSLEAIRNLQLLKYNIFEMVEDHSDWYLKYSLDLKPQINIVSSNPKDISFFVQFNPRKETRYSWYLNM